MKVYLEHRQFEAVKKDGNICDGSIQFFKRTSLRRGELELIFGYKKRYAPKRRKENEKIVFKIKTF